MSLDMKKNRNTLAEAGRPPAAKKNAGLSLRTALLITAGILLAGTACWYFMGSDPLIDLQYRASPGSTYLYSFAVNSTDTTSLAEGEIPLLVAGNSTAETIVLVYSNISVQAAPQANLSFTANPSLIRVMTAYGLPAAGQAKGEDLAQLDQFLPGTLVFPQTPVTAGTRWNYSSSFAGSRDVNVTGNTTVPFEGSSENLYTLGSRENITVPAGTFECVRIQHTGVFRIRTTVPHPGNGTMPVLYENTFTGNVWVNPRTGYPVKSVYTSHENVVLDQSDPSAGTRAVTFMSLRADSSSVTVLERYLPAGTGT